MNRFIKLLQSRYIKLAFILLVAFSFNKAYADQSTEVGITFTGSQTWTMNQDFCDALGGTGDERKIWTQTPGGSINETNWAGEYANANISGFNGSQFTCASIVSLLNPINTAFGNYNASSTSYFFIWDGSNNPIAYVKYYYRYPGTSTSTPPIVDTSTHIISITPNNNQVIPASTSTFSTLVDFNITYYIDPNDIGGITAPSIHVYMYNTDQNVILSSFSHDSLELFNFYATSSGRHSATTTVDLSQGNYRINATLESYLASYSLPFTKEYDTEYSQFIVGTSTTIGLISQHGYQDLQDFLSTSTDATSTVTVVKESCNPLGAKFDVALCISALITPDQGYLDIAINGFKNTVARKIPFGYFTRAYDIFTGQVPGGLPTFSATIFMGPGNLDYDDLETDTITFDPNDMLSGGADLVDSIHDPVHGKNARDIFEPIIEMVVYTSVVLSIFADLTGSHRHHANVSENRYRNNNNNQQKT